MNKPPTLVKRYGTIDDTCDDKVELCKDGKTWFIRKGMYRDNCVCDSLSVKDLEKLKIKIDTILGRKNGCAKL